LRDVEERRGRVSQSGREERSLKNVQMYMVTLRCTQLRDRESTSAFTILKG